MLTYVKEILKISKKPTLNYKRVSLSFPDVPNGEIETLLLSPPEGKVWQIIGVVLDIRTTESNPPEESFGYEFISGDSSSYRDNYLKVGNVTNDTVIQTTRNTIRGNIERPSDVNNMIDFLTILQVNGFVSNDEKLTFRVINDSGGVVNAERTWMTVIEHGRDE